ncbi:MAG TPA: PAS domain S-box protein, partial [Methanomassiliicoccales archaeon]|nr:PAS domain S-box protein [Methanomassiliicoccales archaeon]
MTNDSGSWGTRLREAGTLVVISEPKILVICGLMVIAIFLADITLQIGYLVSVLYVIPVVICMWSSKRRTIIWVALATSVLTVAAVPLKPPLGSPGEYAIPLFNRPVSLLAIWIVVLLVTWFIDNRASSEKALKESENRLRTVLENSADGINMLDLRTGRYVIMNPAQARITGFDLDELNGITAEEAYERTHPDDRRVTTEQQRRVSAGEDMETPVEYRWRVKGGEYRWLSDRRRLVRDDNGQPIALVGISRDITDVKNTQRMVEEERARLRVVLDNISVAVGITDERGSVLIQNGVLAEIFAGERPLTNIKDY